jgi:hypothetical protein
MRLKRLTAQERRDRAKSPKPLPPVSATATVNRNGELSAVPVTMYDKLPGWWSRGTLDQRDKWLKEFFGRQIAFPKETLEPGVSIVAVVCEVRR